MAQVVPRQAGSSTIASLPMAAAQTLVGAPARALKDTIASAIPPGDLDARDTDYIRETLPGLWLLASRYFRADVDGLHHLPSEGPVLLVGNHSGGIVAPDLFVFVLAFITYFGVERPFFQLAL